MNPEYYDEEMTVEFTPKEYGASHLVDAGMDTLAERPTVSERMIKYGGSFAKSLGEALLHADASNVLKIKKTWPELWQEYLHKFDYISEIEYEQGCGVCEGIPKDKNE